MMHEQLDASGGWVRCGHCMDVFDAKLQLKNDEMLGGGTSRRVDEHATSPASIELSFVQQAHKRRFWASSWVRVALLLVILTLALLLFLQIVLDDRNRLNQLSKHFMPVTQWLCERLHCETKLRAQIDQWSIENASFERVGAAFRLQLQLKNSAAVALQMPHLELSLLDAREQLIVRKTVALERERSLDASRDSERSFSFLITPEASLPDIVGYRLVLFYP